MNVFCAYAFTGEDLTQVTDRMRTIVDTFADVGIDAYCNLFDPVVDDIKSRGNDVNEIFARAFTVISECDVLVAVLSSANKSVGQIMEIGVALSQHKLVYILEHDSAKGATYLPKLASATYQWSDMPSLITSVHKLASDMLNLHG